MTRTLHLIDAGGLIHRAWYAVQRPQRADVVAEALRTFGAMLDRIRRVHDVRLGAIAFDAPGATWRHAQFPAYKLGRAAKREPRLAAAQMVFGEVARAHGWQCYGCQGYEADDVVATLAGYVVALQGRVQIYAQDKDLLALVSPQVQIVDEVRGSTYADDQGVQARLAEGVTAARVGDFLALMGDTSDGVPGVPGCGEVTAAQLVRAHPDLPAIIAADPKIRGKHPFRDPEAVARLELARRLVQLDHAVPLTMHELGRMTPAVPPTLEQLALRVQGLPWGDQPPLWTLPGKAHLLEDWLERTAIIAESYPTLVLAERAAYDQLLLKHGGTR